MTARNKIIAGVVALAVLAGIAYAGFGAAKKRQLQAQVVQQVGEAGGRLEASLGVDINAPSAELLKTLDASIEATDAALQELRATSAGFNPALVEAADDYVAVALNVMRRQAGGARGRMKFAQSHKALTAHLAQVGQRGSQWMNEAVKLRQQLDRDYFEYNTAASSLVNMLAGYPASRKKIAALMPSDSLPADAAVKEAHARAVAAVEATRRDYEKAKQLVAPG
jgi:hypothetical protein